MPLVAVGQEKKQIPVNIKFILIDKVIEIWDLCNFFFELCNKIRH